MKRSETTKALNFRTQLPENTRVAAQCVNETFKESANSGNFHIHREWQVLEHQDITIDGQKIDLKGLELDEYITTKWSDGKGGFLAESDTKVRKGIGRAFENYEKLGVTIPEDDLDVNNPPLEVKGKVAEMVLRSEQQQVTETPTEEDIAAGRKRGKGKTDENGKPVFMYFPRIAYILGLSEVKPQAF